MITAVFTFAIITAIGEIILLWHLKRSWLHAILRHSSLAMFIHFIVASINLWIHWGTMTGSMTAVTAFVVSVAVIASLRVLNNNTRMLKA